MMPTSRRIPKLSMLILVVLVGPACDLVQAQQDKSAATQAVAAHLSSANSSESPNSQLPRVFLLNAAKLQAKREGFRSGDSAVIAAVKELQQDANALLRSYIWHCIGIPIVASVLMIVHFWRVRKDGGISGPAPVMLTEEADKPRRGPKAAGE